MSNFKEYMLDFYKNVNNHNREDRYYIPILSRNVNNKLDFILNKSQFEEDHDLKVVNTEYTVDIFGRIIDTDSDYIIATYNKSNTTEFDIINKWKKFPQVKDVVELYNDARHIDYESEYATTLLIEFDKSFPIEYISSDVIVYKNNLAIGKKKVYVKNNTISIYRPHVFSYNEANVVKFQDLFEYDKDSGIGEMLYNHVKNYSSYDSHVNNNPKYIKFTDDKNNVVAVTCFKNDSKNKRIYNVSGIYAGLLEFLDSFYDVDGILYDERLTGVDDDMVVFNEDDLNITRILKENKIAFLHHFKNARLLDVQNNLFKDFSNIDIIRKLSLNSNTYYNSAYLFSKKYSNILAEILEMFDSSYYHNFINTFLHYMNFKLYFEDIRMFNMFVDHKNNHMVAMDIDIKCRSIKIYNTKNIESYLYNCDYIDINRIYKSGNVYCVDGCDDYTWSDTLIRLSYDKKFVSDNDPSKVCDEIITAINSAPHFKHQILSYVYEPGHFILSINGYIFNTSKSIIEHVGEEGLMYKLIDVNSIRKYVYDVSTNIVPVCIEYEDDMFGRNANLICMVYNNDLNKRNIDEYRLNHEEYGNTKMLSMANILYSRLNRTEVPSLEYFPLIKNDDCLLLRCVSPRLNDIIDYGNLYNDVNISEENLIKRAKERIYQYMNQLVNSPVTVKSTSYIKYIKIGLNNDDIKVKYKEVTRGFIDQLLNKDK